MTIRAAANCGFDEKKARDQANEEQMKGMRVDCY
jgi:hypothetical protein